MAYASRPTATHVNRLDRQRVRARCADQRRQRLEMAAHMAHVDAQLLSPRPPTPRYYSPPRLPRYTSLVTWKSLRLDPAGWGGRNKWACASARSARSIALAPELASSRAEPEPELEPEPEPEPEPAQRGPVPSADTNVLPAAISRANPEQLGRVLERLHGIECRTAELEAFNRQRATVFDVATTPASGLKAQPESEPEPEPEPRPEPEPALDPQLGPRTELGPEVGIKAQPEPKLQLSTPIRPTDTALLMVRSGTQPHVREAVGLCTSSGTQTPVVPPLQHHVIPESRSASALVELGLLLPHQVVRRRGVGKRPQRSPSVLLATSVLDASRSRQEDW
jgi:hypothetical protein